MGGNNIKPLDINSAMEIRCILNFVIGNLQGMQLIINDEAINESLKDNESRLEEALLLFKQE